MLNPNAKLNPHIFYSDIEQKATRDGFGEGLIMAAEENPNIVALSADLAESTRVEEFAKRFPERYFECGVAEQNMAAIAAGLGVSGKIPFISSFAVFSPGRNWEQIRTTIAYNDSNVKIAGHHTGISVGADGVTHQATEDIAIMRALPNMKVFVPCDAIEAKKATIAASKIWGPVYLRFARQKSPVFTTEETPFVPGKAEIFWESFPSTHSTKTQGRPERSRGATSSGRAKPQALIIGCGPLLYNALLASRDLEKENIGTVILNCHTIKPLDEKKIVELAKKYKAVVTVEEHQISGGLGGAVAELLAKAAPTPMEFIGMKDAFGESGEPAQLIEKYGLSVEDIKRAVKKILKRKRQ
jgi:transketolase